MRLVALALLLSGCAAYQHAEERAQLEHGRCAPPCDLWARREGGPMPAVRYVRETDTCRCWSPWQLGERPEAGFKVRPEFVEFPAPC